MTVTTVALTAPLIALAHDWSSDVERTRTYPTNVFNRRNGSEQRIALSQTPVEQITYRLIAPDAARAAFLAALGNLAADHLVRIVRWEDQARVTTAVTAGATVIPCDPSNKPSLEAGAQVILWRDPYVYEVGTIDTVGGSSITLTAPIASGWAAGTIVAPVEPVRLVFPVEVSHWVPTSGVQSFVVERMVPDVAGLGTGGTAVSGTPSAITLTSLHIGSLGLLIAARGALIATVTDAAGNTLTNQPIVWSSSDPANLGIHASANPQAAVVTNLRPDASLGLSTNRTATATLGAVSASIVIPLRWS